MFCGAVETKSSGPGRRTGPDTSGSRWSRSLHEVRVRLDRQIRGVVVDPVIRSERSSWRLSARPTPRTRRGPKSFLSRASSDVAITSTPSTTRWTGIRWPWTSTRVRGRSRTRRWPSSASGARALPQFARVYQNQSIGWANYKAITCASSGGSTSATCTGLVHAGGVEGPHQQL